MITTIEVVNITSKRFLVHFGVVCVFGKNTEFAIYPLYKCLGVQ